MEASALSGVITNIGTVFTGMVGWGGDIVTFIQSNALLLVGTVSGFAFTAVALVKRLLP